MKLVIILCFMLQRYYYLRREPVVNFSLMSLIMTVFSIGLSVGVVIAVGMLFYFQVRSKKLFVAKRKFFSN